MCIRDSRSAIRLGAMHVSTTHGPSLQKTARLVVELIANLLTNLTPLIWLGLHRLGIDDFLDHRQVIRQPRRLWMAGARRAWCLAGHNWQSFCAPWSFT